MKAEIYVVWALQFAIFGMLVLLMFENDGFSSFALTVGGAISLGGMLVCLFGWFRSRYVEYEELITGDL